MKVAIFGGSGFVGDYIINELLKQEHKVYALVRYGSKNKITNFNKIKSIVGSIDNVTAIEQTVMNSEAIIYNIGIIREYNSKGIKFDQLHYEGLKKCVDIAQKLNINRFILMSANGVRKDGTAYQRTKFLAEEYLKSSTLNWTIFRPSLIFGDSNGKQEFCSQLKKDMLSLPIPAPLFFIGLNMFNAGHFEMSPIHVEDVSEIFVKSLKIDKTHKQIYHLGGDDFTWKEILRIISIASNKESKMFIPVPSYFIKLATLILGDLFPISKDQLTMLMEGNICESKEVFKIFNLQKPIQFNEENLNYLSNEL